jgi:hypothetical protein
MRLREVFPMKNILNQSRKARTLLLILAGTLVAGILLVSCGGGGYGGGGSGAYGGSMGGMILPPAAFSLTTPTDTATSVSTTPNLMWGASLYATGYYVYIKADSVLTYPAPVTVMTTSYTIPSALTSATKYDWYVAAFNSSGMATSAVFTFTTM